MIHLVSVYDVIPETFVGGVMTIVLWDTFICPHVNSVPRFACTASGEHDNLGVIGCVSRSCLVIELHNQLVFPIAILLVCPCTSQN